MSEVHTEIFEDLRIHTDLDATVRYRPETHNFDNLTAALTSRKTPTPSVAGMLARQLLVVLNPGKPSQPPRTQTLKRLHHELLEPTITDAQSTCLHARSRRSDLA